MGGRRIQRLVVAVSRGRSRGLRPDRRRATLNGCYLEFIAAVGRCAMAASKVDRSLHQKNMAGGNGSIGPCHFGRERSQAGHRRRPMNAHSSERR